MLQTILLRYGINHNKAKIIFYNPTDENLLKDKELLNKLEDIILKGVCEKIKTRRISKQTSIYKTVW